MTKLKIDLGAAKAIAEGRHGDPFSILGPHLSGDQMVVTVFAPGAEKLWVIPASGAGAIAAEAASVAGFFLADLGTAQPYRLRAEGGGNAWEWDDPYRFGPVLGELDEHLLG
ncbi:MAG: 1,4-alpha-glucan branching enzyme, partial [Rhodobacteraceae bacterium]|nr:1,4-alpha-glucan branching enzyme [Paracoccaceae bacterium]